VNESGYREILGICEGAKEDKSGWSAFLQHLKERGLKGIRLITSGAHPIVRLRRRWWLPEGMPRATRGGRFP